MSPVRRPRSRDADGSRSRGEEGPVFEGVVVRQDARGVRVRMPDGDERWCAVRGRMHLVGPTTATTTVAVGDRVNVRPHGAGQGSVEAVLPRRGVLSRPDPHHDRRQILLATNVDRVVVVESAAEPAFTPGFVDRVLAVAEWSCIDAMLVVNKMDLATEPPPEVEVYRRMGHPVILTSAATGAGIAEFREALVGRASVVTGHSGVGKSSLLNAVEPGLGLKVGAVNEYTRRGKQTTTAAFLVPLAAGGAVIDTPGIREFGLYNVPRREITRLYRDLREVAPRCRFSNCLHRGEPGCALPAAVESGEVAAWRVDSYLRLLETMPDVKAWEIPDRR